MKVTVQGHQTFIATGGREFSPTEGEVLVFLHGSGQSHLDFQRQSRFLAYRGFAVLAPDFPAHGHSGGAPLASIEAQADWLAECLGVVGVEHAHIAGHSQGGLVALEFARRHPAMLTSLILLATAMAIPVNDALLELAQNDEEAAIAAMMDWGHAASGHYHEHHTPGASHMSFGKRLMASNPKGVLLNDLKACAAYTGGPEAAKTVTAPSLCVLAGQDRMTPIKTGRALAASLPNNTLVEVAHSGHMVITEHPDAVITAMRGFLADLAAKKRPQ